MHSIFIGLFALGPCALLLLGVVPVGQTQRTIGFALSATLIGLVSSIAGLALTLFSNAPLTTPLLGNAGLGLSIYIDVLSATMFMLVAFIGAVVIVYSRNYLDGDPGQGRFTRRMCLTLGAVLTLIVSGNMVLLALAWIVTSIGLNGLLLFYPERPAAVLAARKKFVVSRLGDLCLLAAMTLFYRHFGTLNYQELFGGLSAVNGVAPATLQAAAIFLAIAALLKSAQFPLHGWLLEVMETPTPVSALLHAGIINAGGFLLLRFSGAIALSASSMELLTIVGAVTALFGSLVMLTQTSIKVSLAYSTIGQMGFMMLECGLGVFSAAWLHIIGHALYKAHAFLSSGSVVDISRAAWTSDNGGRPHPARLVMASSLFLVVAISTAGYFGATILAKPGSFVLGAVVLLGLTHLMASAVDRRPGFAVMVRALGACLLVTVSYVALQNFAERLFVSVLAPVQALHSAFDLAILLTVLAAFAIVTLFQNLPGRFAAKRFGQALYVHLSNGFYVNTLANRLALSLWPTAFVRVQLAAVPHNAGSKS